MSIQLAQWVTTILALYSLAGLVVGLFFVALGVTRVDPAARGTGVGFRLLLLPGSVLLWPMLLLRWIKPKQLGALERNAHRRPNR
ncbi:MAG: hypothetical protein AAF270_01560 [Pseudomonadota bacterium]